MDKWQMLITFTHPKDGLVSNNTTVFYFPNTDVSVLFDYSQEYMICILPESHRRRLVETELVPDKEFGGFPEVPEELETANSTTLNSLTVQEAFESLLLKVVATSLGYYSFVMWGIPILNTFFTYSWKAFITINCLACLKTDPSIRQTSFVNYYGLENTPIINQLSKKWTMKNVDFIRPYAFYITASFFLYIIGDTLSNVVIDNKDDVADAVKTMLEDTKEEVKIVITKAPPIIAKALVGAATGGGEFLVNKLGVPVAKGAGAGLSVAIVVVAVIYALSEI